MKKNKELILAVIKRTLAAGAAAPVSDSLSGGTDPEMLLKTLQYHKLSPFAYLFFKESGGTGRTEVMDILKRKYGFNLARNIRFQEEFLRLHDIFREEGIDAVPFKGLALLTDLYGRYPVRPMTDMDILVKEELLEKAEGILEKHGYSKHLGKGSYSYWREHNLNIPFLKNRENWLLELHFAVDLKRSRPILPEMWKRIRAVRQDGREINMLSPEDTLFSLALHQRRFGSPLCLKNTLDISLLLRRHKIDFDWDYVCREAGMGLMHTTVFFALRQAELFTGCTVPARVMKDLRVPSWKRMLISSFIENNTFNTAAFSRPKRLYLQTHLLIYDGLLEPVGRILNISREEFSKFYDLPLYTARTETLYRIRFLFMLYKLLSGEKGDPAAGSGYRHG